MEEEEKLPITITFEVVQHPLPNDRWYDVTAILSWEKAGYLQRMETAMCLQREIEEIKEGYCLLIGRHFDIRDGKGA